MIPKGVTVWEWLQVKITRWFNPPRDARLSSSRNRAALSGLSRGFWESPATLFISVIGLFAVLFGLWTFLAMNAFESEMTEPGFQPAHPVEPRIPDSGD